MRAAPRIGPPKPDDTSTALSSPSSLFDSGKTKSCVPPFQEPRCVTSFTALLCGSVRPRFSPRRTATEIGCEQCWINVTMPCEFWGPETVIVLPVLGWWIEAVVAVGDKVPVVMRS